MTPAAPAEQLAEFSAFVAERTGLYFPREKFPDLERAVSRAAPQLGFDGAGACMAGLLASPPSRERLERLAACLTVGETYFFRNSADFGAIENVILPEMIARKDRGDALRVWSAGCATGEEPYSLAMLLDGLPRSGGYAVSILATDINRDSLNVAARGFYGEWSFREVPARIKEKYFARGRNKELALVPRIRKAVDLAYLNLAEDSYPSLLTRTNAMDLILCRNVLMYFRPDLAEAALRRLQASLREGGWLILGAAEGPLTYPCPVPGLKAAQLAGLTIYRKVSGEEAPRPVPRRPEQIPPAPVCGPAAMPAAVPAAAERRPPATAGEPCAAAEFMRRAGILADQGRLAEAAAFCARAVEADKFSPAAHYLLGSIFREEGRNLEAALAFRRALYLAPEHAAAHLALGSLLLREGKRGRARGHFRSAAALLERYGRDEVPPDSEGITAGRLLEIARAALERCADA